MPRARNIKPSFFRNECLAELDPMARLLFAGLWCLADREGRLQDRPKRIKAEIFPYEECDTENLLNALTTSEFIVRYQIEGLRFIQVVNFKKHQNPYKSEKPSEIPAPPVVLAQVEQSIGKSTADADPRCADSLSSDSLSSDSLSSDCNKEEGKGDGETNSQPPPLESSNLSSEIPNTTETERLILYEFKQIDHYPLDILKDLEHVRAIAVDFPTVDVLWEAKKWRTYKLDKPLEKKSKPRFQFRNWCEIAARKQVGLQKPILAAPKPSPPSAEVRAELAEQQARFDGMAAQFLKGKVIQ